MPGVPPVHGREEMLQRLETGMVLRSVTITPYSIEGRGDLAYADGLFTCLTDPLTRTRAVPCGWCSSWCGARNLTAYGESPGNS